METRTTPQLPPCAWDSDFGYLRRCTPPQQVGTADDSRTSLTMGDGTSFELAIERAHAGGVPRRQADQSVRDQPTEVHIDGSLVGHWYSPDALLAC